MNNKKLFLRVNTVVLSTFCLLMMGCNKQEQPKEEKGSSIPIPISSYIPPDEVYTINRPSFTPDYASWELTSEPSGINMVYYSDIYSRGFSWLTDKETTETELYIVRSDKGEQADFSSAQFVHGTSLEITYEQGAKFSSKDNVIPAYTKSNKTSSSIDDITCNIHKVHIENLDKGAAYSYKIGSDAGYAYGAFIVDDDQNPTITVMSLSDAQAKDPSRHNVWRNTFTHGVEKAGKNLDLVLYDGDQFDQNMSKPSEVSGSKTPSRLMRYAKALDVIQDYKFNLPYMASSGNHEETIPYSQYIMSDIDFAGYDTDGAYYSFDYNFAHFIVINSNSINDEQINWLKDDLSDAQDATWRIAMLHISPYSTGDNSDSSENRNIVEKLTPVFSSGHVDLVLQAHDHTYSKSLPYKWDAAGYTTTWNNEEVVNFDVDNEKIGEVTYDKNPNGTYYVTTGASGHRVGEEEKSSGVWSDVYKDGEEWKGLDSSKTFLNNKYKVELGTLTQANQYQSFSVSVSGGTKTCEQNYQVGDLATGNVNAQMFGVLNLNKETLSYHVYTVSGNEVNLFDTLDVLKA